MRRFIIAAVVVGLLAGLPATAIAATSTPAGQGWIGGQPTVSHTWLAHTSGWPTGTTFTYRWFQDDVPVAAPSTTNAYFAPANSFDHMVSVSITGTAPGHTPTTITLPALRVQSYNPLAGDQWLPPNGPNQAKWAGTVWTNALASATGSNLANLMKIQNRPRITWVHSPWSNPASPVSISQQIANDVKMLTQLIAAQQNGSGHELVQIGIMGIWSLVGGENNSMWRKLTSTEVNNYKQWLTAVAATIGQNRTLITMEQDLAITMSPRMAPGAGLQRQQLTAWGTSLLARNPNASIYLSAGDADWLSPNQAATMLRNSGIHFARGFELGDTHFSTTPDALMHGVQIVKELNALGFIARHFLIDSSDNGKGFSGNQYQAKFHTAPFFGNPVICASTSSPPPCVAIGVPPTWQVVDTAAPPLTSVQRFYALRVLDGFIWIGGAWWENSSWPFSPLRAYALGASSAYA